MFLTEDYKINKKYTSKGDTGRCVYRIKDFDDNILYIGKSENLKEDATQKNYIFKNNYENIFTVEYIELPTEEDVIFAHKYLVNKHSPILNDSFEKNSITLDIEQLSEDKWNLYYVTKYKEIEQELDLIRNIIAKNNTEINAEDYIKVSYISRATADLKGLVDASKYREVTCFQEQVKNMKNTFLKDVLESYTKESKAIDFKYINLQLDNITLHGPRTVEVLKNALTEKRLGGIIRINPMSAAIKKYCNTYNTRITLQENKLVNMKVEEIVNHMCILDFNLKFNFSNISND